MQSSSLAVTRDFVAADIAIRHFIPTQGGRPKIAYLKFKWSRLYGFPRECAWYSRVGPGNGFAAMAKVFSRIFFVLVLAPLFAASCRHSDAETGLTKITFQADWYPQPEHGGFYTALAKGYYKDEGLDVTILPGGPYIVPEQQVASGGAQFGMSSSDKALESVSDGQPVVGVAATMQHDPQGIMVRKDSPIHSFADLNGHTVAIKPGSTWFEFLVKRFQLNNVHEIPSMMNVANFVANPDYVQQAFATSEPFFAHQAGIETRILLTSDAGYNPYRVIFTTKSYIQQRPDVVAKFVRASLKGWKDYLNDPVPAHAIIAKLNPALNPEWMQYSWQQLRDGHFVTGDDPSGAQLGEFDPKRWTTMYDQLVDLKVIDKPFDPATAYTLQFLRTP
jgi:NitT/TauT family transport system substrate-binding protein